MKLVEVQNLKKVLRLLNLPESADLIELNAPKRLDQKMIELAPLLQISLTEEALKTSLKKKTNEAIKTFASHTLFLVFSVLCILVILAGGTLLSSDQNWQDPEVWLTILLMAGFCIIVAMLGYKIANRVVRATSNPLHSRLKRFENDDMDEKWSHFFDWAEEIDLVIYFKLASSEYIAVPVEIWKKDFVVAFIFGSKRHRSLLVQSSHDYLEALVITAEDWKSYQDTLPKVDAATPPAAIVDNHNIAGEAQLSPQNDDELEPASIKSEKPAIDTNELQVRQKLRGKNTGWCPRLEVICGYADRKANKEYLIKARKKSQDPPAWELSDGEILAKAALKTIQENYDRHDTFFRARPATAKEKQNSDNLETMLRLNLKATEKNETRVTELRLSKWDIMEQYLEKLGFITDAELYELNPKFRDEVDSNPLGIKILG